MTVRLPTNLELAQACQQTYQGIPPMWEDEFKLVHVFFFHNPDCMPTVAFEGTSDLEEWLFADFMAAQVPMIDHPKFGPLHAGMARDVGAVWHKIADTLEAVGPYAVTGHSKGAGEAIIFHALMKELGNPPAITRAFEPPRVGTAKLGDLIAGDNFAWTRTRNVHGNDIVTDVPWGVAIPSLAQWKHVGDPVVLTVSDNLDIPSKHRIEAILDALGAVKELA